MNEFYSTNGEVLDTGALDFSELDLGESFDTLESVPDAIPSSSVLQESPGFTIPVVPEGTQSLSGIGPNSYSGGYQSTVPVENATNQTFSQGFDNRYSLNPSLSSKADSEPRTIINPEFTVQPINQLKEMFNWLVGSNVQILMGEHEGQTKRVVGLTSDDETQSLYAVTQDGEQFNCRTYDRVFKSINTTERPGSSGVGAPPTEPVAPESRVSQDSPVLQLLAKKRPITEEVMVTVELRLPSKKLVSVLLDEFDNVIEDVYKYIIHSLDYDVLTQSIKNSIDSYYNWENKKTSENEQN
jgi:hypothetical protein